MYRIEWLWLLSCVCVSVQAHHDGNSTELDTSSLTCCPPPKREGSLRMASVDVSSKVHYAIFNGFSAVSYFLQLLTSPLPPPLPCWLPGPWVHKRMHKSLSPKTTHFSASKSPVSVSTIVFPWEREILSISAVQRLLLFILLYQQGSHVDQPHSLLVGSLTGVLKIICSKSIDHIFTLKIHKPALLDLFPIY